jgi:hypothetical protein
MAPAAQAWFPCNKATFLATITLLVWEIGWLSGVVDLDRKVRAQKFALHALDAIFGACDFDQEDVHFQDILRTERDADAASLAVAFNDFESGTAHSGWSPFFSLAETFSVSSTGRRNDETLAQTPPRAPYLNLRISAVFCEILLGANA